MRLLCDCEIFPDHESGERVHQCKHTIWVVAAKPRTGVEYTATQAPKSLATRLRQIAKQEPDDQPV